MARHLALIDRALTDIATGKLTRLIVELPPRHGKSELIGRYFPTWYLGTFPERQVIYTSYESRQATKYGRYARNLMLTHGGLFGVRLATDSAAVDAWALAGHEGGMRSIGAGGAFAGKGADVLIIDDPIKGTAQAVSEAYREKVWNWWEADAYPRLEPNGAVVIVQTRWHKDDLAGRVQRDMADENWHVIRLPALAEDDRPDLLGRQPGEPLWPARWSKEMLGRIRDTKALYWWLCLYQQRPVKHGSVEWPDEYFADDDAALWFDEWPAESSMWLKAAALDPSKGKTNHSDYAAFAMVAEDRDGTLWVEADLDRRPPGKIVSDGVEICRQFRPAALGVEGNAWQDLLGPMFVAALNEANLWWDVECFAVNNQVAKENRIRRLDPYLRARKMRFRRTTGTRLLVSQMREFPLGTHDDGPDALEMAVRLLHQLADSDQAEDAGRPFERVRA